QARFGDRAAGDALHAVERLSAHSDPRVSVGLAPHSVRAVGRAALAELSSYEGVLHMHVSEQRAENEACRSEHGCTPTELLADLGLLTPRFTAVHLTWPEPGDIAHFARTGARVCVCPTTELDLGDGFLPLEARDLPLALGSDSQATIDPWLEARSLELHARALAGRRNVMAPIGDRHGLAARLLRIATVGGASALGAHGHGIVPGAPADLVAVDLRRPAAVGVPPQEALVFCATPEWVDRVWVAGELIVSGGRHPQREAIVERARITLARNNAGEPRPR
ncbi:MAG: formimidoylglutamate deiminase, partial [Myxococcota bacterium]